MSNAAKHRKKAAEFEQLKQIDRAIASYVRAIEESETAGEDVDVALYNKVGDLALRQGRVPDAITYYERAVEHYATSGLFNNAIALCNKILRNAPGRANVYFTLGRISARKGLRGDATRNFLEYATRMQQEGRIEEGLRALAEVLDLMPELNDVRTMVEDLAARSGIALPRRRTPLRVERVPTPASTPAVRDQKSQNLIFLDVDYGEPALRTPPRNAAVPVPPSLPVTSVLPATVLPVPEPAAPPLAMPAAEPTPAAQAPSSPDGILRLDGLEANGDFIDLSGTAPLAGFTPDEPLSTADAIDPAVHPSDVTWILPPDAIAPPLDELVIEEFENATDDPTIVRAIYTEAPEHLPSVIRDAEIDARGLEIERVPVEPVPELDEAIAAGRQLVELAAAEERRRAEAERSAPMILTPLLPMEVIVEPLVESPAPPSEPLGETEPTAVAPGGAAAGMMPLNLEELEEHQAPTLPPFRLDPHDFILPGELPPLLLDDRLVESGLSAATEARAESSRPVGTSDTSGIADALDTLVSVPVAEAPIVEHAEPVARGADLEDAAAREQPPTGAGAHGETPAAPAALPALDTLDLGDAMADEGYVEDTDETLMVSAVNPVTVTPSVPIAAVAEAAANVASSRRDSLRAAVARLPKNWLLRRRLAEALFEAGERDAALHELETAQQGLVTDGEYGAASDIADELVQVSPDRVVYHQKRVELAVRSEDQQRLRLAYLDLADALVRLGEEGRARAVYARVLEIDPYDDRARAALGAAAPPPPPARPDDAFVDLADWLHDENSPADTRMRMKEPAISGDEQADFDALLRHFKEGVSRSLGEDDYESHYDLGVAYKEMGLLDDAIAEFQKALRSRTHRLPAYEALGQCFVEQGRFQIAVTVLSRALHEPGLDDDQRVGVLYLLGYSCEALQREDEARGYFQRVYATDINFRDVAARLAAIEQASR